MAERSLEFSRDFKVADTGSNIVNVVCPHGGNFSNNPNSWNWHRI